jgi:hypothetical protein
MLTTLPEMWVGAWMASARSDAALTATPLARRVGR